TVWDACAGAGGKTLHLGALMNNKGRLIASDVSASKLEELERRAKRNRLTIVEMLPLEDEHPFSALVNSADRVLLDVPCTGMGVLRRQPDTKWKLTLAEMERLIKLQQQI